MKSFLFICLILFSAFAKAQKIESIYVHLYTDSLKKGTYNYINIDGLLTDGSYQPLDSSDIIFWSSDGKFFGNDLWVDKNFIKDRISIKATLKHTPLIKKEFTIYIKKKPDEEHLKTSDELLREMDTTKKTKKKS